MELIGITIMGSYRARILTSIISVSFLELFCPDLTTPTATFLSDYIWE